MADSPITMDKIVSLAKQRGFIFPGSEIYGGLANSWDYGPLGVNLKNNIRDAWWRYFVLSRDDMVGLDSAILMNPKVWEASGHVQSFADALVDCKECKARHRADHLIENSVPDAQVEGVSLEELDTLIAKNDIACPNCGKKNFTNARKFNLLFETSIGTIAEQKESIYLRGELAAGMFTDFKRILETTRKQLPFGIAQVGKVFRNEITPGNFTFRTLEFDLMEFEYFIKESEWETQFDRWLKEMYSFLEKLEFDSKRLRTREHTAEELSHYSKRTVDIEYETPFGWKEMFGLAYRTDFDLRQHSEKSGESLMYTDPHTQEKFYPHVVEPTFGLTRLTLMVMLNAYTEEEVPTAEKGKTDTRVVMKFPKRLAPYQVAVLPLSKKENLSNYAREIAQSLRDRYVVDYDETQSIGKRYRRQDEIGTPYCVTVDFESLEDKKVTIRDRDTMKQDRVPVADLREYLNERYHA